MKKKSLYFSILVIFLLIPATLWLGTKLPGRSYYLTCTLIILYTLALFFLVFESRKPQARELVTLSVMSAIAVASRAVFAMIPHFKPITAIVMITGFSFGPEAGFLVGAVSAFASNFIFGQGPWTPWQMMAYGIGGFLAGLFHTRKKWLERPVILAVFGFTAVVLVVGPLLDTSSLFTMTSNITKESALAIYGSGIPVNIVHGTANALTMLLFSKPLLEKLERIRIKYGMMED